MNFFKTLVATSGIILAGLAINPAAASANMGTSPLANCRFERNGRVEAAQTCRFRDVQEATRNTLELRWADGLMDHYTIVAVTGKDEVIVRDGAGGQWLLEISDDVARFSHEDGSRVIWVTQR